MTISPTPGGAPGRPNRGLGHYLRDVVNGSLDGVITTLAVVSGTVGADLEPRVGIILGIANLAADGVSMGASNYLGLKSELEQTGGSIADEMPWRHGLATTVAFSLIGAAPLLAYVLPRPAGLSLFSVAIGLSAVVLGVVGALRARYLEKAPWRSAAEMLGVGTAAATCAYLIGALLGGVVR
ncbi:MAG: hypothetical protein DI536_05240 [Archangium gephyra]|uniref:VIT family protein n=1 Tax=Archangium gephyra TaxID=48 RepID=A0A2W5TPK3_9BACT|nr:MAG: hypothetical protein DI536_05240 [Archangium gephyra]